MATPKTTAKKAPAKTEAAKKKAADERKERYADSMRTSREYMTNMTKLQGGQATATGQSLMPPSVAKGLVSREEYVNLLVVTYTEKLETEMTELNEEVSKLKLSLDADVIRMYKELGEECRKNMVNHGVSLLQAGFKAVTGKESVLTDTLNTEKMSVVKYADPGSSSRRVDKLPVYRFDIPDFHNGYACENLCLVDVVYYRIFGSSMSGRPDASIGELQVEITISTKGEARPSRHSGQWYHPERRTGSSPVSIALAVTVKVPDLTAEQQTRAMHLTIGYQRVDEIELRIGELNGLLQNGEKLRRKALAVMTAQAIGVDGIKALPQLESKL